MRAPFRVAAIAVAALLAACARFNLAGLLGAGPPSPELSAEATPAASPEPSRTAVPIQGGISGGDMATSPPAPPTPLPTPTPTTAPTQPVYAPRAVEVVVVPKTATLNVFPRQGATPLYPTTVQLKAEVLLSSGLKVDKANWRSLRPETATVDDRGLVTAGSATGDAVIVATSLDGDSSGSATVTLTDHGAAEVVVD